MRLAVNDETPAGMDPLRWSIAFVIAVTAARVLALWSNATDLYFDEAQYWTWSRALDWGYYSKPPLIAAVIAATTSLFGHEEWAVRLGSPLLHGATALVLMRVGTLLYGRPVGAWTAVVYATLPAVSFSSTLISTDVPLLLAWSAGLLAAIRLLDEDRWGPALAFGAAVAVGLNAKYPMALLPVLLLVFVAITPALRSRLASPRLWGALVSGALGLLPNAIWNARNGWVTLLHTQDNANWQGLVLHPDAMLEFAAAQFGVFGPVLMAALLAAGAGFWSTGRRSADRFLLTMSLPILALFTVQGLLSRANANWGATAYPAATVLATALLLRDHGRLFRASLILHGIAAAALLLLPAAARDLRLPNGRLAFERIVGWSDFAASVADTARSAGARTLLLDRRSDTAALLYYLRDEDVTVAVLAAPGQRPTDHYQLTIPFRTDLPQPGLLVWPADDGPLPGYLEAAGPTVEIDVLRGVLKAGRMAAVPVAWPRDDTTP